MKQLIYFSGIKKASFNSVKTTEYIILEILGRYT